MKAAEINAFLAEFEIDEVALHKSTVSANRSKAMKGKPMSEEAKAKLGASVKGLKRAAGHKHSPETRAKMSAARSNNPENRARLLAWNIGRVVSQETKDKIAATMRLRRAEKLASKP
jgi:hypothetical protein